MNYLHLDVFTSTPFEGNQLAVFPSPAPGIEAGRMQRIAREMAFSETTFVFPRTGSGDARMRIFTPATELPMAGHPTVGSAFALAHAGVIEVGKPQFVFELGVGPTPVELEWTDGRLTFAWMTQPLPAFGAAVAGREGLAAAVGLEAPDLADLPIEPVSCGVPYLMVPLASRAAVDRVEVDRRAAVPILRGAGAADLPMYFFTTDRQGAAGAEQIYSRMLAPDFGISEDPATGSACGPLGCYLLRHGVVGPEEARRLVALQGAAMGRPSVIHISIDGDGRQVSRVRVGGTAVLVAEGRLL
jgi:trans-2,3-dihydro-3-hydroxyanthranilate isomerase